MKLIRRRDPLVQITIRPSQDNNCWMPSNNKKLERTTLVLLLNQYSRLIYIFPIWLVQNRKRACLWTRRTANLRNCMKKILFSLLFCLIYILWGFLFFRFFGRSHAGRVRFRHGDRDTQSHSLSLSVPSRT